MSLEQNRAEGENGALEGAPFLSPWGIPVSSFLRPARPERKIALCGFWEVTRGMQPDPGTGWEIWGCNHGFPYVKKGPDGQPAWDVWIDIHDPAWSAKYHKPEVWADMEQFLKARHGKPIYMQRHYDEYPDSVPYPREEVQQRLGVTLDGRKYFTNAMAYLIPLALIGGATEIGMYGADMRGDEEYATQRPCVEYWLGRAEGMGVKVFVPKESGLLNADSLDYGYDEDTNAWVEMRRALEAEMARAAEEKSKALATAQTYDGVVQSTQDLIRRVDQRRRAGGIL